MRSSGGRIPVIIDTDPGIDDAVALLLAMASPEIEVLGITAVAGNVPLPVAVGNALSLVELAGHAVPVYAGCARPLVNQLQTAGEEIHGSTGLGNDWPAPATVAQPQHGVDYLIEQCLRYKDNPLTICALGPLTNLAMALVKCPEITRGIQRVLVMGGALRVKGNYTDAAEFNMHTDPHAAHVVFNSGVLIELYPLDLTEHAVISHHWLEGLKTHRVGRAIVDMLQFYHRGEGGRLHDPCVIAGLLQPELYGSETCQVDIEIWNRQRQGEAMAVFGGRGNVRARTSKCPDDFFEFLQQRLALLDKQGYV